MKLILSVEQIAEMCRKFGIHICPFLFNNLGEQVIYLD